MSLTVRYNNIAAISRQNLLKSDAAMNTSLRKLSSGLNVESARDGAADMALGSRLSSEINSLNTVSRNAQQGVSMLQIAEGGLAQIKDVLVRLKVLSTQASSGHLSAQERALVNTEYQSMLSEIDRLANDTVFNGVDLINQNQQLSGAASAVFGGNANVLEIAGGGVYTGGTAAFNIASAAGGPNGSQFYIELVEHAGSPVQETLRGTIEAGLISGGTLASGTAVQLTSLTPGSSSYVNISLNSGFTVSTVNSSIRYSGSEDVSLGFKVGTGSNANEDSISVNVQGATVAALGISTSSVTSIALADVAGAAVKNAIDIVNNARAELGSYQARLENSERSVLMTAEYIQSAQSVKIDLDVAQEMAKFTGEQIVMQAGVSMVAEAIRMPQQLGVLFQ